MLTIISKRTRIEGSRYIEPAIGRCGCGTLVQLSDPLDNVCEGCGTVYNMGGQEVTHSRHCDESGEPYCDD